jgi:hypothetical protein
MQRHDQFTHSLEDAETKAATCLAAKAKADAEKSERETLAVERKTKAAQSASKLFNRA